MDSSPSVAAAARFFRGPVAWVLMRDAISVARLPARCIADSFGFRMYNAKAVPAAAVPVAAPIHGFISFRVV
jgi:hypothetical protein